jgi:hypothetical protein
MHGEAEREKQIGPKEAQACQGCSKKWMPWGLSARFTGPNFSVYSPNSLPKYLKYALNTPRSSVEFISSKVLKVLKIIPYKHIFDIC